MRRVLEAVFRHPVRLLLLIARAVNRWIVLGTDAAAQLLVHCLTLGLTEVCGYHRR